MLRQLFSLPLSLCIFYSYFRQITYTFNSSTTLRGFSSYSRTNPVSFPLQWSMQAEAKSTPAWKPSLHLNCSSSKARNHFYSYSGTIFSTWKMLLHLQCRSKQEVIWSSIELKNCTCTGGSSRKGRRAQASGVQMTSWKAKQTGREARMRAKLILLRRQSLRNSVLISTRKHPSQCPRLSLSIVLGGSVRQRTKQNMDRTTSKERSTQTLACSYSATMQRMSNSLCILPFKYHITALKSIVITAQRLPKYTQNPTALLSPTISVISLINIPGRRNVNTATALVSTQCGRILIPMRSSSNSGMKIREQTLVGEGGLICTKQARQLVKQYWKKEKFRSEGKEGWKQKQCSVVSQSRWARIKRDRFVTRVDSSKYIIPNASCFTFPIIYYMLQDSRARKTQRQAETTAFTCYLIYFTVAALFILVLLQYSNYLSGSWLWWPYGLIIIINTYLLLTTGANPGFIPKCLDDEQVQIGELGRKMCIVCQCEVRNRSKHCFRCGRCVMKYDHHCPWIGSCVGEYNHGKFWWGLLFHTLLSSSSLKICYSTMQIYGYATQDGSYQPEFGVFAVFGLGMFFYLLFAGCLLLFHTYLLITNTTTKEIIDRNKLDYLRGIKGNPFSEGCFRNIAMTCCPQEGGRDWVVSQEEPERGWMSRLLSNEYYECC